MPLTSGAFTFLIDLHVHTAAYSPCAELLDPMELDGVMERRGIHGVLLTEHDVLWSSDALARLRRHLTGVRRIYRGIEVSCDEGHFIAVGIERDDELAAGMPVRTLLAVVHDVGGAVIWAHPFRPARTGIPCLIPSDAPDDIDAVEVFSTVTNEEMSRHALDMAHGRSWHAVAGSDAHNPDFVGVAVTGFAEPPADETALATAIRQGAVQACRLVDAL